MNGGIIRDGDKVITYNRIHLFESGMGRCVEDERSKAVEKLNLLYQEHGLSVLDKIVATYTENMISCEFGPFLFWDRPESDEERVAREKVVEKLVDEMRTARTMLSSYEGFARDSKPVLDVSLIPKLVNVYIWVMQGRKLKEKSRQGETALLVA